MMLQAGEIMDIIFLMALSNILSLTYCNLEDLSVVPWGPWRQFFIVGQGTGAPIQ